MGERTDLDALFVVHAPNHFDAHLRDLLVLAVIDADVAKDLDDALAHTDARVEDTVAKHRVILTDELGSAQDELPYQFDGRLAY